MTIKTDNEALLMSDCGHGNPGNLPCAACVPVTESAFTRQVGGNHYSKLPIQPFQYSMANGLDPMQHTAIKYITRFRDGKGIRDLRAAIHTLELLIELEEAKV